MESPKCPGSGSERWNYKEDWLKFHFRSFRSLDFLPSCKARCLLLYHLGKRLKIYTVERVKWRVSRLRDASNSKGEGTILKMERLSKHVE